jgi:hypothetical protein
MEDNKLIAEFMGFKQDSNLTDYWSHNTEKSFSMRGGQPLSRVCQYDSPWDWLMSVVEKINDLGAMVTIQKNACRIDTEDWYISRDNRSKLTTIKATYECIVGFIKWYNRVNQTIIIGKKYKIIDKDEYAYAMENDSEEGKEVKLDFRDGFIGYYMKNEVELVDS